MVFQKEKFKNVKFSSECISAKREAANYSPDILSVITECGFTKDEIFSLHEIRMARRAMPRSIFITKQQEKQDLENRTSRFTMLITYLEAGK